MLQAQTRDDVYKGLAQYGAAPGGRKMINDEESAAQYALETGIYAVYRNNDGKDCSRVAPGSKCFCGHVYSDHAFATRKSAYPTCQTCSCSAFRFVPSRPEEVGEWWLVRRKGFNVHTWRAKCRCGHPHEEHHPKTMRCKCGCSHFQSNFACLSCDKKWEDHETVFETIQERMAAGRSVGDDFLPLSNDPEIRQLVFPGNAPQLGSPGSASQHAAADVSRYRPAAVHPSRAEKSVQIMHETSGGRIQGQSVTNRYGRVANPPQEYLYMGGASATAAGSKAVATSSLQGTRGYGGNEIAPVPRNTAGAGGTAGNTRSDSYATTSQIRAPGVGYAQGRPGSSASQSAQSQPKTLASGFKPVYD